MSNVIIRPNVVTACRVQVWAEDDLVCLRIGNSETLRMSYNDGIVFANHLRAVSAEAKSNAGDRSSSFTAAASLTPLDHNGEPIKPTHRRKD